MDGAAMAKAAAAAHEAKKKAADADAKRFFTRPASEPQVFSLECIPMTCDAPKEEVGLGLIGGPWFAGLLRKTTYDCAMDWCCGTGLFGMSLGYVSVVKKGVFVDISKERLDFIKGVHEPLNPGCTFLADCDIIEADGVEKLAATGKYKFDLIAGSPPWFDGEDDKAIADLGVDQHPSDRRFFINPNGRLYLELLETLEQLSAGTTEVCFFGVDMEARFPELVGQAKISEGAKKQIMDSLVIELGPGPPGNNIRSVYFVYKTGL